MLDDELRLLITGASRGLGRALSLRFASMGYRLILTARTEGALAELSAEIVAAGFLRPIVVAMDLRDGEQIDNLGLSIGERFSCLDGVILNAAHLGSLSPLEHGDTSLWRDLFMVNVLANHRLLCCLHGLLLRSRVACGGVVVGVTCKDYRGTAFWSGYGATKAAFETMLCSYARENTRSASTSASTSSTDSTTTDSISASTTTDSTTTDSISASSTDSTSASTTADSASTDSSCLRVYCIDPGKMSSALRSSAFPGEAAQKYPITARTLKLFTDIFSEENS